MPKRSSSPVGAKPVSSGVKNTRLLVLALVMIINALAYGTIIPLLYPYASRFGITPLGLSFLFASFSLAQFISTPILGRLSDRFGRKPVLVLCLLGTSLSLGLFAAATNVVMLFAARLIDGITGGNISVAQAMIADSTTGTERAKSFGLLGAAFGFGFLLGPALGGLLSQFGLTTPFWFASGLALVGTIAGWLLLPETLSKSVKKQQHREPLFNVRALGRALFSPVVGVVLLVSVVASTAGNAFIIGFQSFTVDILRLSARDVGLLFALSGVVNILAQGLGIRWLLTYVKSKKLVLVVSLLCSVLVMGATYFSYNFTSFVGVMLVYMITASPQVAMLTALLSERTNVEDQGEMLGINQSFTSLGQIVGPLVAGLVTTISVPAVFLLSCGLYAVALLASRWLYVPVKKVDL